MAALVLSAACLAIFVSWSDRLPSWRLGGAAAIAPEAETSRARLPELSIPEGGSIAIEGDSLVANGSGNDLPIASRLEALLGGQVRVLNRGFGGDTAPQGMQRWRAAECVDLAIIHYGANDAGIASWRRFVPPKSVDEFGVALERIIARHRDCGAQIVLVPSMPTASLAMEERIAPYRNLAIMLAEQKGVSIIDVGPTLAAQSFPLDYDGLHLNAQGRDAVARVLAASIRVEQR